MPFCTSGAAVRLAVTTSTRFAWAPRCCLRRWSFRLVDPPHLESGFVTLRRGVSVPEASLRMLELVVVEGHAGGGGGSGAGDHPVYKKGAASAGAFSCSSAFASAFPLNSRIQRGPSRRATRAASRTRARGSA